MEKAVYGIVNSRGQIEQIVDQLIASGFSKDDISILFSDAGGTLKEGTLQQGNLNLTDAERRQQQEKMGKRPGGLELDIETKAPEGGLTGGTVGGIIGGTLGLLAGIGSLAIPGMGPFIAAGPIMGALAGSGVGGAVGMLTGALIGMGIPENEVNYISDKLKNESGSLIAVRTNSSEEINKAKAIFEKNGAEEVASKVTGTGSNFIKNKI